MSNYIFFSFPVSGRVKFSAAINVLFSDHIVIGLSPPIVLKSCLLVLKLRPESKQGQGRFQAGRVAKSTGYR